MTWKKDRVLTDTVWIFIKKYIKIFIKKVNLLFPKVGIRGKAMQRLFIHNLALHSVLLPSEPTLSFSCADLHVRLSRKHYMRESVGGAKQAVM